MSGASRSCAIEAGIASVGLVPWVIAGVRCRGLLDQEPVGAKLSALVMVRVSAFHRIPQDIALVSFDGTTESAHTWPPLTVIRRPLAAMADAAITDILRTSAPKHDLFDMELLIRQSCGCTPGGEPS